MISGHKLLIADDSATIQKIVELTFLDQGMMVTSVGDGNQAIDSLEEFAPDVVLADVFMPGRNGYEVCDAIKQSERFRNIPVMLLVGSFEPFDEAEARRVGADDVLTKPFQSIRQLVNLVGTLLGGNPAEDEATTRRLSTLGLETMSQQSVADTGNETAGTERNAETGSDHQSGHEGTSQADTAELMSTAEIELTTADTKPLTALKPEAAAYVSDHLMSTPMPEPALDVVEPFASSPASGQMQESEPPLRDEPMDNSEQQMAATTADDSNDILLDLGDLGSAPGRAVYVDSILELEDEAISVTSEPDRQPAAPEAVSVTASPAANRVADEPYEVDLESGWSDSSTVPSSEKFAAIEDQAENSAQTEAAAWEIVPSLVSIDASLDGPAPSDVVRRGARSYNPDPPQLEAPESTAPAGATASESSLESVSGQRLSPEDIDAIARRVVEHMSDKVVREIAWEVVPELSELLIKRRLEDQ